MLALPPPDGQSADRTSLGAPIIAAPRPWLKRIVYAVEQLPRVRCGPGICSAGPEQPTGAGRPGRQDPARPGPGAPCPPPVSLP
ncbi:hypothetical protein [Streptomyces scopuliridis]|uniref:hypothetical protein n=1 Tax=Streptomyces scopuliridis TaxID=452529 RepID=UPI00367E02B5